MTKDEILSMREQAQATGKPVLRRPQPPRQAEREEPLYCAMTVKVWLKGEYLNGPPQITGYASQHGVSVRAVTQEESLVSFFDDETLTGVVCLNFSDVLGFITTPIETSDESAN